MKPDKELEELRSEIIGSLSRANMQECGSRYSEIVIEKEADRLQTLIASKVRAGRKAEWQRIYDHFNNIDPETQMPDPNSPIISVMAELAQLSSTNSEANNE